MYEENDLRSARVLCDRFGFVGEDALAERLWATSTAFDQQPNDPEIEAEANMLRFVLRRVAAETGFVPAPEPQESKLEVAEGLDAF